MKIKIVSRQLNPPIPDRRFDWEATRDGWDEGEPIGYGSTEEEAIVALKSLEQ